MVGQASESLAVLRRSGKRRLTLSGTCFVATALGGPQFDVCFAGVLTRGLPSARFREQL